MLFTAYGLKWCKTHVIKTVLYKKSSNIYKYLLMQFYTHKFSKNLWFDRLDYVLSWNTFEEFTRTNEYVILITQKIAEKLEIMSPSNDI
jgi:hypothetical protein